MNENGRFRTYIKPTFHRLPLGQAARHPEAVIVSMRGGALGILFGLFFGICPSRATSLIPIDALWFE
ncbi:MAG: hypothetical protein DHS20C20_12840 [Ardenticatenaceae bacterium]|nr:MAG: hypothetical protein DHS20C20_12840 [Ardenticatenaceae bacterium]